MPRLKAWSLLALAGMVILALLMGPTLTATPGDYAALEEKLRHYVDAADYEIYVSFEDLTTGAVVGIRDREPVPAGSTIKVPLVLYLYQLAREDRISLDERIHLTPEDFQGTDEEWEPGLRAFSLRELAISALQVSDNVATNGLFRRLGREKVYAFMGSLGAIVAPTGPGAGNRTSARDVATYFKAFLRFQAGAPSFGQEPLNFLYDTPLDNRLVAHLPWDLRVAHKIGTYQNVVGDGGIVFLPGRPYVLAVFVRHPWRDKNDEEAADRIIAEISYLVYEYQSRLAG